MYPNTGDSEDPLKYYTVSTDFISLQRDRQRNAQYFITKGSFERNEWSWAPGKGSVTRSAFKVDKAV